MKLLISLLLIWTVANNGVSAIFDYQCNGDPTPSFILKEKELVDCLLSNYNPMVRPVRKVNDTVTVKMNMATMKVSDIDEKNHMLKLRAWIYQEWNDPQLTWTPADYDGIQEVRIPVNRIWAPDIVMYNYAEMESMKDEQHSEAVVTYKGRVLYYPLETYIRSGCRLDMAKFPFDTQTCHVVFGTWSNPVKRVNITVTNKTMDILYEGHEWQILHHKMQRMEQTFDEPLFGGDTEGSSGTYAMALYTISLRRNPVYYQHMFVAPAVFIMIVTLFVYLVPPEANERLTLCGLIMVGITVLLLMLENHLPTEVAQAPILVRFLLYTLFMDMVASVVTIFSLNCYHRDIRRGKVPNWMRKIFLGKLSSYLCMRGAVYNELPTNDESMLDGNAAEVNTASPRDLNVDKELTEHTELPKSTSMALEKTLDEIRRYLRILAAKSSLPEPVISHRQVVINEWHQVALVLDRLAFVFFVILTFVIGVIMAMV